ncbi:MAG: hypothetical protein KUG74_01090 [Rhodobacteraceae bacterium]|nr:hypothetical protein [Paracoccaceae bacterium]
MAVPPLEFSASVNPQSGTGSDIHEKNFGFDFGGISNGSGDNWVSKIMRDAVIGVAVALAAKYVWTKIK